MLFGEKTRPVSDFLPRVMIHIDGVDVDLATSLIMDAIIHFARDSKVLSETVCIGLDPCIDSYKIHTRARILEVLSARLFVDGEMVNTDEFAYRIEGDTLYTPKVPACGHHMMELTFSTAPLRDSLEVPEVLYEDWIEAIVALALYKLYLMTDNEWHNPTQAAIQMRNYEQILKRARVTRITRHKPLRVRLKNLRRL